MVVDTREPACDRLLRHYALVFNRLAAWPEVQSRLGLTMLAYDQPDAAQIEAFSGGVDWVQILSKERDALDQLSAQLGILPLGQRWCEPVEANAILVSPQLTAWALIPHEQATMMARNIATIVHFVE